MELSGNKVSFFSPIPHFLLAAGGGMLIGFVPEGFLSKLYYNTGLEPYSPAIAITALLLGYFVGSQFRGATGTWVIGLLWLAFGMYDTTRNWSASWSPEKTAWGFMLANLFGPTLKCSGSECLYELLYTTPFAASITYSVGAYLRGRKLYGLSKA